MLKTGVLLQHGIEAEQGTAKPGGRSHQEMLAGPLTKGRWAGLTKGRWQALTKGRLGDSTPLLPLLFKSLFVQPPVCRVNLAHTWLKHIIYILIPPLFFLYLLSTIKPALLGKQPQSKNGHKTLRDLIFFKDI